MTPSSWIVLTSLVPPRGEEPFLVEALRRVGARTVERQGEHFAAYFPAPVDVAALVGRAEAAIRASTSLTDPIVTWRPAEPADWEQLWGPEGMTARRVTDRLMVTAVGMEDPSGMEGITDTGHQRAHPSPGAGNGGVIRLRPGPFFGSAEHPTTRSCLQLIDPLVEKGARILDVGTGSGILAIAAAHLGAGHVIGLEADPAACLAARDNVALNAVADRVEIRSARADAGSLRSLGPFDGTLANIEPAGLVPLLPGLASTARGSGWLLLSGVPGEDRERVVRAAEQERLRLSHEVVDAGWWAGILR